MTTQEFILLGAVNPRGAAPAICTPAFSCPKDNYTYIQHVGINDTVVVFELADFGDWEPVRGSPKQRRVSAGSPAVYWICWSDDLQSSLVGEIELVRTGLIDNRWIIDNLENPFERLDFAQISGQYEWFAEEAKNCELSFEENDRSYWLRETLLLNRVRFAVESVLLSQSVPSPARRRVSSHLNVADTATVVRSIDSLCKEYVTGYTAELIATAIKDFLDSDLAYRYASAQIFGTIKRREVTSTPATWYKQITRSDAQRKRTGNQRGGITLVKAGFPINAQTYFRLDFFSSVEWVSGKTRTNKDLETASVRMKTHVLGEDLGVLSFSVSYARNRHARQNNYTSVLHLGPLSSIFSSQDMTNKWLSVARLEGGLFALSITDAKPL